jgi:hypothetical protein
VRFGSEIHRIRALVRELGGARALRYLEGSEEDPGGEVAFSSHPARRDRSEVIAELKEATSGLVEAMARPAGKLAVDSLPRSVRLGAKVASVGVRSLGRAREEPRE